jgi:hypothetical protein
MSADLLKIIAVPGAWLVLCTHKIPETANLCAGIKFRALLRVRPQVNWDVIRRVLRQLKKKGRVTYAGSGFSVHWRRKGNTLKKG